MVLHEVPIISEVEAMINQATVDKLHGMRLSAMAEAFASQAEDQAYTSLTFEERFGMIVDHEWGKRRSNKLQNLIRTAGFRYPNACMESIEYLEDRKLNKSELMQLSTCRYIQDGHHI